MKRYSNLLALAIAAALAFGVLAVGCGPDAADMMDRARELSDRYQREIQDVTLIEEFETMTEDGPVSSEMTIRVKGDRYRWDLTLTAGESPDDEAMEAVIIFDGQDSWIVAPLIGARRLTEEEASVYKVRLFWWQANLLRLNVAGSETVSDRDCLILEIESPDADYRKLWVDPGTMAAVQAETPGDDGEPVVTRYSDFRTLADGIELAGRTEMYDGQERFASFVVKDVQVNTGLTDDLFEPQQIEIPTPSVDEMIDEIIRRNRSGAAPAEND